MKNACRLLALIPVLLHLLWAQPLLAAEWQRQSPRFPDLMAVWGTGSSEVCAVGRNGLILRCDGKNWIAMETVSTSDLYGVWADSPNSMFAVGADSTILHFDGAKWTRMAVKPGYHFLGVFGFASNDVFAVGAGGAILHYDGNEWTPMNSGTSSSL